MSDITPLPQILDDEEHVVDSTLQVLFALQKFSPTIQLDIMRIVADVLAVKVSAKNDTEHRDRMERLFKKREGK